MKNLTKYESNCALFLISKSLFLGLGTVKIISSARQDLWISIILGILIGLFINYIFTKMSNKNSKFFTYIYSFVLLTLGTIFLTKTIFAVLLDKTPVYLIMAPLLLLIYYLSIKKEETIYHVASIILFINIFLLGITFVSLIPSINIDNFLPIYTTPSTNIILSAFDFALISTIPFILIPEFKEKYNYKSYLLSGVTLLIMFVIIIGVLGYDVASIYRYPEYMIFKRISLLGFINNIENILFMMGILEVFTLVSFSGINIKKNTTNKTFIFLLLVVFIMSTVLLINYPVIINIISENISYILISLFALYILGKF